MMIPILIDETQAKARAVQPGWWTSSQFGELISGPYPSKEAAIIAIGKRGEEQSTGRPGSDAPAPE